MISNIAVNDAFPWYEKTDGRVKKISGVSHAIPISRNGLLISIKTAYLSGLTTAMKRSAVRTHRLAVEQYKNVKHILYHKPAWLRSIS